MNDGASLLKSFVERIEAQEELKADIGVEIRGLYAEAKAAGFDPKTLRKVIARRKKGEQAVREESELILLYESAISGQMKLPLDEAPGTVTPFRDAAA